MTTNRLGTIERTPEGGLVRFERSLPYPVEDVWAAITEPERLADWWPPFAADITVDLRVGGAITFTWPDPDMATLRFDIVRLEPPTLLEHTHTSPGSWMRWELTATDTGTRLLSTYAVPDLELALGRGDVVGGHYSLDRLESALAGRPGPWDNDAFAALQADYAALTAAAPQP